MKKILLFLMALLVVGSVFAANPEQVALRATLINQNPDPVEPGEYLDIKIRLDNYGQSSATNVEATLVEDFPISFDPGKNQTIDVGNIGPNQNDDLGVVLGYEVRISRDAVEGDKTLKLSVVSDNQKAQIFEFDIEIKTQDTGLIIDSVSTEELEQGKQGTVEIKVLNPSDSTLRDVIVSLDLETDDLPLAPIDSSTTKRVNLLSSGSESIFRFNLAPLPDATANIYKVPVEITYYNSLNELVTKEEVISVIIGTKPDVSIYAETDDFYLKDKSGVVTITFVNKGLIDVKFLDINLEETEDYEVISSKESYVGGVDSDDFESADFTIMKNTKEASFNIIAKVEYKDAINNDYSETLELPVKLYPQNGKSNNGIWIILVIVIVVAGFFYFRKRKKNA